MRIIESQRASCSGRQHASTSSRHVSHWTTTWSRSTTTASSPKAWRRGVDHSRRPGVFPIRRPGASRARHRPSAAPRAPPRPQTQRPQRGRAGPRSACRCWAATPGRRRRSCPGQRSTTPQHGCAHRPRTPWSWPADDVGLPLLGSLVEDYSQPDFVCLAATWSLCCAGDAAVDQLPALTVGSADAGNLGNAARYTVRVVSGTHIPLDTRPPAKPDHRGEMRRLCRRKSGGQ